MNKSSQVLKWEITDATLVKWSKRHCREQSDRNTGKEGKKRGFETDCWEQKSHTEPGLVMHSGTTPESGPGKMSSTVKTLWDPKIREKGQ